MPGSKNRPDVVHHLTVEERRAVGKRERAAVPLSWHASLDLAPDRDALALLEQQEGNRVAELLPIRHGRMLASPFAFLRGAALPMAFDLSGTPTTGLEVQLCGDAHLSNFGAFAAPDRRLVFDLNDFDETHPGPFEWDVKRLAASIEVVGRDNGYKRKKRRLTVTTAVQAYREHVRDLAGRRNLDVWYERLEYDALAPMIDENLSEAARQRLVAMAAKARTRDSIHALGKLTEVVDGEPRFISTPPLLMTREDLLPGQDPSELVAWLRSMLRQYRQSLQYDRRVLLEQFRLVDIARKVVGVGSVGTRAWVLLLLGRDDNDPLFLQAKEANVSVLAPFVRTQTRFRNEGERVVSGQHVMQAASDIFLGSLRAKGWDGVVRDYYVRQLRDWKMAATPSVMEPDTMVSYARLCGHALARAHARAGDRVALAAYLGSSTAFDEAVADFAEAYADVTARDHAALADAVASGRVSAVEGL